jgi:bacterioferritin
MKGNQRLIDTLNQLLADELTATNQYILHSEMCANWGYEKLHDVIEHRAIDEMKHAEKLIARVLFLEGLPIVSKLNPLSIGETVAIQLQNDMEAEYGAVVGYNEGIRLAVEVDDNTTRALLESILHDEEEHIDWLEAQRDQIQQVGLANYLAQQI